VCSSAETETPSSRSGSPFQFSRHRLRATSKMPPWSSMATPIARWRVMVLNRKSRSFTVTVRPLKPSVLNRLATWSESRSSVPSRNSGSRQSSGSVTS